VSNKIQTAFRLSEEVKQLLRLLADKNGVSMSAIIELTVRQMADEQGVVIK
jgi:predicted DNA-binding protein